MGLGGIIATVVGTAVSVSTSLYAASQQAKQARAQGKAQQAMANYNARVAENQQTAANQNAKVELQNAKNESERQKRVNKEMLARQEAAQMKTGGTFSGSAILTEEDQLQEMKLMELDILHQGEMRAREHKLTAMQAGASAMGSQYQGNMAREMANYRAKSIWESGQISAATSLLAPKWGGSFGRGGGAGKVGQGLQGYSTAQKATQGFYI